MTTCFNCKAVGPVHHHHVVPRSLGGVATVPLCHVCHGKAHGRERGFRDTNELIRAALAVKRSRGEATSHAPYGYRSDAGRLVADEGEQAVIARVREARARGLTVRAIAAKLAAEGVVTRSGGAPNVRFVHALASCDRRECSVTRRGDVRLRGALVDGEREARSGQRASQEGRDGTA